MRRIKVSGSIRRGIGKLKETTGKTALEYFVIIVLIILIIALIFRGLRHMPR